MRPLKACVAAIVLLNFSVPAADARPVGDATRVAIVTFGPGDHPFFKFGHNAILVEDATGAGEVFNFGTFNFDSPSLIPKFLMGRFMYWLSRGDRDVTLDHYRGSNRSIDIQDLALSPADRRGLQLALNENAKAENAEYLYDYFWDNCSTRVRDVIDRATHGRLQSFARATPAPATFRQHALRLTADLPWEYVALHFGLGSLTDRPVSLWEDAFIPEQLQSLLRKVRLPADDQGPERALVTSEAVAFRADRPAPLAAAPHWGYWFLAVGLFCGLGCVFLGHAARRSALARWVLGLGLSGMGFVTGFLGTTLIFLWAATNHKAAWANENILQMPPFALALALFGIGVARGRPASSRRAYLVILSVLGASVLGLMCKPLPAFSQDNGAFIALMLPMWLGLAVALRPRKP